MPHLRHPPIATCFAMVPAIAVLEFLASLFFVGVLSKFAVAQEQPQTDAAPGFMTFGLAPSSTLAKDLPQTDAASPAPGAVRLFPSPNHDYAVYEGKAVDGYHDTLWLKDSATGPAVDLLAPVDAHWPGTGATTFMEWLDNDRLAFTIHCGTGCTSLEVISIKTRAYEYFCTAETFFISPDKRHAVGQTNDEPALRGGPAGGLVLIDLNVGNSTRQYGCPYTIRSYNGCGPNRSARSSYGLVTFDRWSDSSRSFIYNAEVCTGVEGHRTVQRVFNLK
jgi:hypothetical protein